MTTLEHDVVGHDIDAVDQHQRMPSRSQLDRRAARFARVILVDQRGDHGVEIGAKAPARAHQVERNAGPLHASQGLGDRGDLGRERSQDLALFFGGGELGFADGVVVLDQRGRLDEEGLAGTARPMNDRPALAHGSERIAADWQHHPTVALGPIIVAQAGRDRRVAKQPIGLGQQCFSSSANCLARARQRRAGIGADGRLFAATIDRAIELGQQARQLVDRRLL